MTSLAFAVESVATEQLFSTFAVFEDTHRSNRLVYREGAQSLQ